MFEMFFGQNVPSHNGREKSVVFIGQDDIGDMMFIPMTDNAVHPVNLAQFTGFGLGIAAGDDNLRFGVGSNELPNGLPGLHGGFSGDAASIDNANVRRFFGACRHASQIHQPPGNGIRLILIDLAAQGRDGKLGHWLFVFLFIGHR
jgi:hypothetical protein